MLWRWVGGMVVVEICRRNEEVGICMELDISSEEVVTYKGEDGA